MQDSQGSPEQPKPKPTVKCKDCGFLAFKYLKSGKLTGVDAPFREKPNMNERGRFRRFSGRPVCFVAATDMDEEIGMSGPKDEIAIPEVISKERECGGYTSVIHGLSPREHLQMQLMEEQKKREDERDRVYREWQIKMEYEIRDADAKREDARDNAQRAWHASQSDIASKAEDARNSRSIWFSLLGVAVGLLIGFPLQLLAEWAKARWMATTQPITVQLLMPEAKDVVTAPSRPSPQPPAKPTE
jgi:hypothetical protein